MASKKVTGIVIDSRDYNEYDKIINLYTKEYGKIGVMALGVNKVTSKNRFGAQLFAYSEFEIFKTNHVNKLSKLKTAFLLDSHFDIANNFNNYLYAASLIGTINFNFEPGISSKNFFNKTIISLKKLSTENYATYIYCWWLFFLFDEFGGMWNLNKCSNCNSKVNKYVKFEEISYQLLCVNCIIDYDSKDVEMCNLILSFRDNLYLNKQFSVSSDVILKLLLIMTNYCDVTLGLKIIGLEQILEKPIIQSLISKK